MPFVDNWILCGVTWLFAELVLCFLSPEPVRVTPVFVRYMLCEIVALALQSWGSHNNQGW
jgi:hypothetical protein